MATTKLVTLERLSQFKTLQDNHNAETFLGIHATADKATVLETARTIDGVSFDGSANITLPTKIVRLYPNEEHWYSDSGFTTEVTSFDTDKLYIDMTDHKAMYWSGAAMQVVAAVDETARIAASEKNAANGVCPLDANAKVPAANLPSYVDDVIQVIVETDNSDPQNPVTTFYNAQNGTKGAAITEGEADKIYVDINATIDGTYRWAGSPAGFVKVGSNVSTADSAVKATNDVDGNPIKTTYVKVEAGKGLMSDTQATQLASLVTDQSNTQNVTEAEINALFGIAETPGGGE